MYTPIGEMIGHIEDQKTKQEQIQSIRTYAEKYPEFRMFLHFAFFNKLKPLFTSIPDYAPNTVDITFSYIKMEKGLQSLKFFFEGKDMIVNTKRREDRLISILEEMSWLETPIYEMLVLNKFKNKILTKKLVIEALPKMETVE